MCMSSTARNRKKAALPSELPPTVGASARDAEPKAPAPPTGTTYVGCHSGELDASGKLRPFKAAPAHFRPTLTPRQMLLKGMHGGIYFNPKGGKPGIRYPRSKFPKGIPGVGVSEFPPEWFAGVPDELYLSRKYSTTHNHYGVKSGLDQAGWESSGWINTCDPRGWTQWYFRFFAGRRLAGGEDERQIARWNGVCGDKGRWKQNLIAKCLRDGKAHDDASVSPVVRQTLLHWAYELNEPDFKAGARRVKTHGATYVPREQLHGIVQPGAASSSKPRPSSADDERAAAAAKTESDAQGREARAKRRAEAAASPTDAPPPAAKRARRGTSKGAAKTRGAPVKPEGDDASLSPYEEKRDATKARNQQKLVELGLA